MKILIADFEGDDNSAKILLDEIQQESNNDILYLKNDFEMSGKQIQQKLLQNYDYVLIFGQKPNTKNIYLENNATLNEIKLITDYYYGVLKKELESNNYKVVQFNMSEIREYRNRETLGDAYRKPYAYEQLIENVHMNYIENWDMMKIKIKHL